VFGFDRLADLTPATLMTIGLAHPLLYALTWTLLLTTCTRVISGEIERGTAELLLTLPTSRAAMYVSVSSVCTLAGAFASAAPPLGIWIGQTLAPPAEPIEMGRLWVPVVNLFALYVAIGGATMFVASLTTRRGKAIAIVLAGLLGSLLLNFLANIWAPAQKFALLGILHYYQPLSGLRTDHWPLTDLVVLLCVGLCGWLAGLYWFSRRDIPAA
jgi:ABC-type transport system involved in multi-copper enzyme maturation permease subunit